MTGHRVRGVMPNEDAMGCSGLVTALALLAAHPAGPGFDGAQAGSVAERLVCADGELARLDRRTQVLYSWSLGLARLDGERSALRGAQQAWLARRGACAKDPHPRACLQAAYADRIADLERTVGAVPDAVLVVRERNHPREGGCEDVRVSWPALEKGRGAAAFSAFFEEEDVVPACQRAEDWEITDADGNTTVRFPDDTFTLRSFQIPWKTERFVTVVRTWLELEAGGAHPIHSYHAATFDLARGRAVELGDVLRADPSSRRELARRIRAALEAGEGDAAFLDDVETRVLDRDLWIFDGGGATVRFQTGTVAPFVRGNPEVRFTWTELAPFLREESPLPDRGEQQRAVPRL